MTRHDSRAAAASRRRFLQGVAALGVLGGGDGGGACGTLAAAMAIVAPKGIYGLIQRWRPVQFFPCGAG